MSVKVPALVVVLIATSLWVLPLSAQSGASGQSVEAIAQRLDELERQNTSLLEQISVLRRELDELKRPNPATAETLEEKVQTQADLLAEQNQVKIESSQRFPVRLTGMVLFNAFKNSAHGQAGQQYSQVAQIAAGPSVAGASMRQTTIGLEFQSPYAVAGGSFRGNVYFDLYPGDDNAQAAQARLRFASIEGQWKNSTVMAGLDKPIFAPRQPDSLAQVGFAPLVASGNLYLYRPRVGFEQKFKLSTRQEFQASIGVSQVTEDTTRVPALFLASVEARRPALQGHFQLNHQIDEYHRVEIAAGFHTSTSHVAGMSIPSRILTLDWFWNPLRRVELTGAFFTGKNLASVGGAARQAFTFRTLSPGRVSIIPVRDQGGWAQLRLIATSRLSFNLQTGIDDPNNRDLTANGFARNHTYVANMFYRLAPNVVTGVEVARARARYVTGQKPMSKHYDLYLGYMF